MSNKSNLLRLSFALCLSCCMLACTEIESCDDLPSGKCDGDLIITGCQAGSPRTLYTVDCKKELSENATCGMFQSPFTQAVCYEPCTTENEESIDCIDHTAETDYDPRYNDACIFDIGSTECIDNPPQRPNTYRLKVCKKDPSGILYWDKGTNDSCLNYNGTPLARSCCSVADKYCNRYTTTCDQDSNTAIFCNRDFVVEHKSCDGADYSDPQCSLCMP